MFKQIYLAFFLLFFISFPLIAQESSRNGFLNQIFDSISDDPIKCSSEIPDWAIMRLKKVLETEGSGFSTKGQNQKCELSKEERKFLLGLVENKKIKTVHDFESKLKVASQEEKMVVANMGGGQIFTFSEPVFFRDDAMVFFFQSRYCGSKCAEGRWSVYRKQSGEWAECLVILSFVS